MSCIANANMFCNLAAGRMSVAYHVLKCLPKGAAKVGFICYLLLIYADMVKLTAVPNLRPGQEGPSSQRTTTNGGKPTRAVGKIC